MMMMMMMTTVMILILAVRHASLMTSLFTADILSIRSCPTYCLETDLWEICIVSLTMLYMVFMNKLLYGGEDDD